MNKTEAQQRIVELEIKAKYENQEIDKEEIIKEMLGVEE